METVVLSITATIAAKKEMNVKNALNCMVKVKHSNVFDAKMKNVLIVCKTIQFAIYARIIIN